MKTVLTIAGSDCSGGAGVQADLKTMAAHGVFGMSVIVSVVAENTARVIDIQDIILAGVHEGGRRQAGTVQAGAHRD